jgi:hypothetical protein
MDNPRIVCADGFSMSVQARSFSYCTPREDDVVHTHMEGGFPSSTPLDLELRSFAECNILSTDGSADYTETVYGYVPRKVFEREFELHGGIMEGCLPK